MSLLPLLHLLGLVGLRHSTKQLHWAPCWGVKKSYCEAGNHHPAQEFHTFTQISSESRELIIASAAQQSSAADFYTSIEKRPLHAHICQNWSTILDGLCWCAMDLLIQMGDRLEGVTG